MSGAVGDVFLIGLQQGITGSALLFPYDLNGHMYATAPAFLSADEPGGKKRGPAHFKEFYKWEHGYYERGNSPRKFLLSALGKIYDYWYFYIGIILTPAFFTGMWALRRDFKLFFAGGVFYVGFAFETWSFPH